MQKKIILLTSLLLFCSFCQAKTIHVIYPENSSDYKSIAKKIHVDIKKWQKNNNNNYSIKINNSAEFSIDQIKPHDLIVNINKTNLIETHIDLLDRDIIFTFNTRYNQKVYKKSGNHAYIFIDQPLSSILLSAQKAITKSYKKTILVITSQNNTAFEKPPIKPTDNIKFITIKEGDIAAKKIEPYLYQTGAIAAIYDPKIWSGNSARWILQQAYNNKVPVIGYSKAFLKAGAISSVYSSSDQIIEATNDQIIKWIVNKNFSGNTIYPDYKIEVNNNIAKALNFSNMEIIELGEKQ